MTQSAPTSAVEGDDARLESLTAWLESLAPRFGLAARSLRPASVDASSRRYFRLDYDGGTLIAMDAPPAAEDSRPFVRIAALMQSAGINVPEVLVSDLAQGFLLLTDLGDTTYLRALNDGNAAELFGAAIDTLIRWQRCTVEGVLPPYDEALLRRELSLFPDWFIARHLQRKLTVAQSAVLDQMFTCIVAANLAQPKVFVHRDYMPRNLMVSKPNPGVLDFQDAVVGPIAYDVVSLFRDAFVSWDDERVLEWTRLYFDRARAAGLAVPADFQEFWRDFEWMGVQRHLKVLGIFARIRYRDGKPHYLEDAPRFIGYVRAAAQRYRELAPLARLFDELELA
ncbi:MAG: phosphotransferase [Burkholderiaceae bacterium]|nr:phosphotransferase [Burkholderiaceae bacterium]